MPYPITGNETVQLSQMITGQALIQNTGDSTVYMGPETSTTSLNYELFLPAGATVNYDGGPLFAICAPGETSTIGVKYGANTSITPGPSTVTTISSSILFASFSQTTGPSASPILSTQGISTLYLNYSGSEPGNQTITVVIVGYADAAGAGQISFDVVEFPTAVSSGGTLVLPNVAPYVRFTVSFSGAPLGSFLQVYGVTAVLPESYQQGGGGLDTSLSFRFASFVSPVVPAAGGTYTYYPCSWSGDATLSVILTVAAICNIQLYTYTGDLLYNATINQSGNSAITLPRCPFYIRVSNPSASPYQAYVALNYKGN